MIGIRVYDGYSGDAKVYLAESIELNVQTRTLILEKNKKIKLGALDIVEFVGRDGKFS